MSSLTNIPASGGTSTQTPAFGSLADLLGPLATGATTAFNQPYQKYDPSQLFAPFTPDQNTAFGQIRSIATDPTTGQGFTNARNLVQSGTTPSGAVTTAGSMLSSPVGYTGVNTPDWSPQAMNSYMDPALDSEVASTLKSFDTNADRQTAQERANLAGEQAFGEGGDQALGNFTGQIDSARGALESNLRSGAYNTALGAFQNDATRNLTASTANQNAGLAAAGLTGTNASRLGSLGLGQSGLDLSGSTDLASILGLGNATALGDANALESSGATQQTLPQNINNFNYQQWLQGIQYPWTQVNNLTGVLNGTPHGSSTTTTPSTSAAQAIGLGIAGLGALPSAVSGANSLVNLFSPSVNTASIASQAANDVGSMSFFARGGQVKGAFDSFATGGRIRFDDGGPIQPDAGEMQPDPQAEQMASADPSQGQSAPQISASALSDSSASPGFLDRLTSLIGGGRESDPQSGGTGFTGAAARLLDNPLVALGASLASTPGGNTGLAIGQGLLGAVKLAPQLKQEAATLRNSELQGNLLDTQNTQKNLLLNFQKGGNGMTQTADGGMLLDPRRIMQAIQMYTAVGDGRSAAVYKGLLDMASKGNFDPATGQVKVGKDVLQGDALKSDASKGVAPGLDLTAPVSQAPGAPAALAAPKVAAAIGTLPVDLAKIGAEGNQARTTQAAQNKVVAPNSTVIPGGIGSGAPVSAPLVGPGSAFNRVAPQAAPAPSVTAQAAPQAAPTAAPGIRMVTPPVTYTEDNQKALAKEMADTQSAVAPASQALKQIQDIGHEDVNSGPGTLTMADIGTTLGKFGIDMNQILPAGWQNDPNKVGVVETNLQELAMSLAKASQSGARFTNADLLAAMQSKPNLMLAPGARTAVLNNLEQRERLALDKAEYFRDYAKKNGGQLDWNAIDGWKSKVMANQNYPDDLKRTYMGLNETTSANTPAASSVPKGAVSVIRGPDGSTAGFRLSNGSRVKADGSPF